MKFNFVIVGLFLLTLFGCTQRVICPAFQSAFIHDKDALTAHFSYFQPDSTPKVREVDKSRYLLVEPVAYNKRTRELRTVPMVDVYPVLEDSVTFDQDELFLAERDVADSTLIDTHKEKLHPGLIGPFNTDQELYMYYLQDILVLPDEREAKSQEAALLKQQERLKKREERRKEREAKKEEEKEEKKGPFSIFKKKDKEGEPQNEEGTEPENTPSEEDPPQEEGEDNGEDF